MNALITSDQEVALNRVVEDGVRKAIKTLKDEGVLTVEAAQRVLGRGDELQGTTFDKIRELTQGQYPNEEIASDYAYPPVYQGPKPIEEQIKAIAAIFGLDPASALEYAGNLPELPGGAEGWFAIPSVDALAAKHFSEVTDPAEQYCRAVQLVHQKLAESRPFYNYREGQITPNCLRLPARTVAALVKIAEVQKGEILIVAAQLGLRHRGRSVRRAREVFVVNEFGLGSLFVGAIALTHPERYIRWEQLHTDCDDEFAPDADGDFSRASCLDWNDGKLGFGTRWVGRPDQSYGLVSAFLP